MLRRYFIITKHKFLSTKFGQKVYNSKVTAWVRKVFCKDVHTKTLACTLLLAGITALACEIAWLIPAKIIVSYRSFDDDKVVSEEFYTWKSTVEAAIKGNSIDLESTDYVYPAREMHVSNGMEISVRDSKETTAEIAGKEADFHLIPGTTAENLNFNGIKYDEDDIVSPALDAEVAIDSRIVMQDIKKEYEEKTEAVAARNLVVFDPSIESGVETTVAGHDGEGVFTYTTTYINGVDSGTERTLKEWITEPVDNATKLGSSITGHTGTYEIVRTFTANTTAYWLSGNPSGASGGACIYGTAAVDPSTIPYGTMMWVSGYGPAVANDCGSAVKGDIVDLWMRSYNESLQWGRRYMNTYILKAAS